MVFKNDDFSEKIQEVINSVETLKQDVAKHSDAVQRQIQILEEIRVSADLRKRESENSVREIKTQMHDMDNENDKRGRDMVDKIISTIEAFHRKRDQELKEMLDVFQKKISDMEGRITSIELREKITIVVFVLTISILISI